MNEAKGFFNRISFMNHAWMRDEGCKQVFEACLIDLQLHTWTVIVMERVMFVLDEGRGVEVDDELCKARTLYYQ